MTDEPNNSIYADDELADLLKLKNIRMRVIDNIVKDGPPSSVGEIRVLNETIANAEKNIQDTASNRLKHEGNANKEAVLSLVAATLKAVSSSQEIHREESDVVILEEHTNVTPVAGELAINPERLDLADFVPELGG